MKILEQFKELTAVLAMLAAVFAGLAAWWSFRLAKQIRDEFKSDEVLVAGVLHNPDLLVADHGDAVVQTTLFNKSKRKVFVSKVTARDGRGEPIDIDWADSIDVNGNPQGSAHLIGITDSSQLCVRRRDGKAFREVSLEVTHSFSTKPLVLQYSIDPGWQSYFAK